MYQPYLRIKTDQYPLAQLAGAFCTKTGRTVLFLVLASLLFASLNANAGDAPSGDETKVVWQNPAPSFRRTQSDHY